MDEYTCRRKTFRRSEPIVHMLSAGPQESYSLVNEVYWKPHDSATSSELEQTKYGFLKS
jgi:hypothetical protein